MQNPSSYYAVPKCDGRNWTEWPRSERGENYSWSRSSSSTTLGEASSSSRRSPMKDLNQRTTIPISYTLTPPTPSATDSDASSSSQISMESIPEYDEMPEIPFVSAAVTYADEWLNPDHSPEEARILEEPHTSFWSGIIGMRPSTSKSSENSSSPVLGHTNERVIAPSRTSRKRSGSVSSSIASSRTRPAPAKSILSSSSSMRTRRRKAPSVKFLDKPMIHYEDDDYDDDPEREPSSCMSPPPHKKARGLSGFFSFKWLFSPSSPSKAPAKAAAAPARPTISGPFPLWDSPPQRARGGSRGGSSAASLRSMKSSGSLRSVRTCGSRLPTPTYWPR